jgi:hypothetical protein
MQAIQFIESGIVPQDKFNKNSRIVSGQRVVSDDFLEQRGTH